MSKLIDVELARKEHLTSIVPPVEFPCVVDGKLLAARVTHYEWHPIHFIYHVSFSDGHKTNFYSLEDAPAFFEDGKGNTRYATAITDDLMAICGFRLDKEIYCIPMGASEETANVWITQDWNDDRKYDVRVKGRYRFAVAKTSEGWFVGHPNTKVELTNADHVLAVKVCNAIDNQKG